MAAPWLEGALPAPPAWAGGPAAPIGLFDSGLGGLSVWREIRAQLPAESTLYIADQAHVPYGSRQPRAIRGYCEAISERLLEAGCKAVVVACNTASAVALKRLRKRFVGIPILGLEPAVKPAAALSRSGVVGVMATPTTFRGRLYRATVGKHAGGVTVVEQVCPGLADLVERGEPADGAAAAAAEALLRSFLEPMLAQGADTIVLGCTHYPFVIERIRQLVGPDLVVVDPAPAVARHLGRVLVEQGLAAPAGTHPWHGFASTADPGRFSLGARRLVGLEVTCSPLQWRSF